MMKKWATILLCLFMSVTFWSCEQPNSDETPEATNVEVTSGTFTVTGVTMGSATITSTVDTTGISVDFTDGSGTFSTSLTASDDATDTIQVGDSDTITVTVDNVSGTFTYTSTATSVSIDGTTITVEGQLAGNVTITSTSDSTGITVAYANGTATYATSLTASSDDDNEILVIDGDTITVTLGELSASTTYTQDYTGVTGVTLTDAQSFSVAGLYSGQATITSDSDSTGITVTFTNNAGMFYTSETASDVAAATILVADGETITVTVGSESVNTTYNTGALTLTASTGSILLGATEHAFTVTERVYGSVTISSTTDTTGIMVDFTDGAGTFNTTLNGYKNTTAAVASDDETDTLVVTDGDTITITADGATDGTITFNSKKLVGLSTSLLEASDDVTIVGNVSLHKKTTADAWAFPNRTYDEMVSGEEALLGYDRRFLVNNNTGGDIDISEYLDGFQVIKFTADQALGDSGIIQMILGEGVWSGGNGNITKVNIPLNSASVVGAVITETEVSSTEYNYEIRVPVSEYFNTTFLTSISGKYYLQGLVEGGATMETVASDIDMLFGLDFYQPSFGTLTATFTDCYFEN